MAIVLAVSLALLPTVVAVVVSPRLEYVTRPSGAPPRGGSGAGEAPYDFLRFRGLGQPIRWNPCQKIRYEVNLANAPDDALGLVEEAFRRTSEVTGVGFRFVGTTERTIAEQDDDMFLAPDLSWYPVLVAWLPRDEFRDRFERPDTDRHALAVAYATRGHGEEERDQYTSAYIAVDADARMAPRFAGRYSLGLVLMHEAGHVMGLGHVKDPDQLMFSDRWIAPAPVSGWAAGDREGLERLGEGACLERIRVAR